MPKNSIEVAPLWKINDTKQEEIGYYDIAKRICSVEDKLPRQTGSVRRISMLLAKGKDINANTGECFASDFTTETAGKPSTGQSATMAVEQELSRFSFVAQDPISCSFLRHYAKRTYCEENLNLFIAVKVFHSQYDIISGQERPCKSTQKNVSAYRFAPVQHETVQRNSSLSDGSDDIVDSLFSHKRSRSIGQLALKIWNRFCDDKSKVR